MFALHQWFLPIHTLTLSVGEGQTLQASVSTSPSVTDSFVSHLRHRHTYRHREIDRDRHRDRQAVFQTLYYLLHVNVVGSRHCMLLLKLVCYLSFLLGLFCRVLLWFSVSGTRNYSCWIFIFFQCLTSS